MPMFVQKALGAVNKGYCGESMLWSGASFNPRFYGDDDNPKAGTEKDQEEIYGETWIPIEEFGDFCEMGTSEESEEWPDHIGFDYGDLNSYEFGYGRWSRSLSERQKVEIGFSSLFNEIPISFSSVGFHKIVRTTRGNYKAYARCDCDRKRKRFTKRKVRQNPS